MMDPTSRIIHEVFSEYNVYAEPTPDILAKMAFLFCGKILYPTSVESSFATELVNRIRKLSSTDVKYPNLESLYLKFRDYYYGITGKQFKMAVPVYSVFKKTVDLLSHAEKTD